MAKQLLSCALSILFLKRKGHSLFYLTSKAQLFKWIFFFALLIGSSNIFSQEVDTWFTADRAVNSAPVPTPGSLHLFTPLPPADGTPVTTWYDFVDFTTQDAVQHPNPVDYPLAPPDGFQHSFGIPAFLDPGGSIPGLPILRRNDINFNPSIEFDGSGDGQALHFRSNSREDITLFIVFKAQGAGNTAESQRLLFGGDIDTHHSSTTNLSLGVSDGDRFSIGRTWTGDLGGYFESGTVDLKERTTIGTFYREVSGFQEETLITKVNGLNDLMVTRNHNRAQQDLYLFNRLGKHFNSNDSGRNLTGNIAEILLADGPLDSNSIQRVESYLAIKYGITLNNDIGLGSDFGNENYQYLAADGTSIWQVDPIYKFDIAGLGKDRYRDLGGIRLRYNLHQRISKSVNTEAIVTISTNTNFSTDNLDDTRTAIDANHFSPIEHNYLVWGNDHAGLNTTNVELPVSGNVSLRIPREWKVRATKSVNAGPISNVSVMVDLSASNILISDACAIQLMIDTDGDGDFTTGPITYITATSVVGTDAFFDNINFEDEDVFSIAYGDFTPPTGSNLPGITVCDIVPVPDPSEVTDEDDNCAVDSVVHLSDVSDGMSNPETIERTYRITDTSSNFTDVTQTITIYTSPDAGSNNVVNICEGDLPLDLFASLGGTPDIGGTWNDDDASGVLLLDPTNVNFIAVPTGMYNFTYTVTGTPPCPNDTATVTVVISQQPTVDAGSDEEICEGDAHDMSTSATQPTAADFSSLLWSSAGDGAFDDATLLLPIYTPGANDITNGSVVLTLTANGNASCSPVVNAMTLTITPVPTVDAPADVEACDSYTLPALVNGDYFTATNGGGTALFAGNDITNTQTLFVFRPGTGSCPDAENSFTVTINDTPLVDAPSDVEACDSYTLPALVDGNYFDVTNGGGNPLSPGDNITTTTTIFVYAETGTTPNCNAENSFLVTINDTPLVDAPSDVEACDSYTLPALVDGNYFDATNGGGTALFAGNDITNTQTLFVFRPGTGSCPDAENSFTVTINDTPTVDAGSDEEICEGSDHDMSSSGTQPGAANFSSLLWSSAGDGVFNNVALLLPTYTPGANDITNGSVVLTLTANENGSCNPLVDDMTLTISNTTSVDAPADVEACDSYTLPALVDGDYFTATNGGGTALFAGNDITNTQTLFVFRPGTGSCPDVENSFTVTINDTPLVDAPSDVEACDSYTLPALVDGNYFDVTNGGGNPLSPGDNITTTTTIFVYAETGTTPNCNAENSFLVTINDTPLVDAPSDVEACDSYTLPALVDGNYFDATNGGGTALFAGNDITTTTTIFVFRPGTGSCPDAENSFTVTINDTPLADAPADVEACDSYTLPALVNGDYFTATNGGGTALFAGNDITVTTTVFVFRPGTGSCPDVENSFTVTINDTPLVDAPSDVEACDSYTLPALVNGDYFTATNGGGTALFAGNDITNTTTIFVYAETGTTPNCNAENSFLVTINDTPLADAPSDVEACDSYTLPALVNGDYFTATNGGGTALFAGNDITVTTTVFVFRPGTGSCPDVENSFTVTINDTPLVDAPSDVEACDSYTLPALVDGNYFDATNGGGNPLSPGDNITTTTTIFVYAETGTTPNCNAENSFLVTINDTPLADAPADVEACDSYTLPALVDGNYFDATNGGGNPLSPGDNITNTTTIFVYAETGTTPNCNAENSFLVTINDTPLADAPADVTACDSYTLPALVDGNYFDTTNGGGNALSAGDNITVTTTLFVFRPGTGSCPDVENSFLVTINDTPLVDAPTDVTACESYTLPALVDGNYFDATNGGGNPLSPGDNITNTTTIFVYAETGTTPNCNAENSFLVTINDTPLADAPADVEACDSYTLPALVNGDYFTATNGGGNPLSPGDNITNTTTIFVYAETGTTPNCNAENSFLVTINDTPLADAPADVEACDSYTLPALVNGDYFDATNGGGTALFAGNDITNTTTIFVFRPGTGSCPDAENSFTVTINDTPLADAPADVEACDSYTLPALVNGDYFDVTNGGGNPLSPGDNITTTTTIFVYAETGTTPNCNAENSFTVTIENFNAIVEPIYACGNTSLNIILEDPSIADNILYALDSTDPNNFIIAPNFTNLTPGEHFLSILHNNGCLQTIPFEIKNITPLLLNLANTNINEITATTVGGTPPYTYFFNDGIGTTENIFNMNSTGDSNVRVVDSNGCETTASIFTVFLDIEIPDFFTPNNDGQNDFWGPRNIESLPNIQTLIFDRYGREIKIMGQSNNGWDGLYKSNPMPSGDYWYTIQLNDDSGREFIGHFTLYR